MKHHSKWQAFVTAAAVLFFCCSASGTSYAAELISPGTVVIPGPLRSFLRMSAISQKSPPEEVLPLLARNVVVEGYEYGNSNPRKPTEFMTLLKAYLAQARELAALSGKDGMIRIANCSDVKPLLKALGYQFRQSCGAAALLETEDADRAFLTVDSGFPLTDLEEALRHGKAFSYPYPHSEVPVLFSADTWSTGGKDFIDTLLDNPALCRLYWAMSRLDEETQDSLKVSPGLQKLLPVAPVLDFYGEQISIRSGHVIVPGGKEAEPAWKSLVGASSDAPGQFVAALLQKDDGWMAAYYDALARVGRTQQAYFTDAQRLKKFYEAFRGKDKLTDPARPVFRPTPALYLLTTRAWIIDGQPYVPGNLEIWKEVFRRKSDSKVMRDWAKKATGWKQPEDLMEALFGLSRVGVTDGPLQIYLQLTQIDRERGPEQRLDAPTVRIMADKYSRLKDQYLIFSEWRLGNDSIRQFIATTDALDAIKDRVLRTNATGLLQANIGIWQVLARQEQIPPTGLDGSFQKAIRPFSAVKSQAQLYDSARLSLDEIWRAAEPGAKLSEPALLAALAGPAPTNTADEQVRQQMANKMRAALDSQRLVSLDTIFELGDGLTQMAQGNKVPSEALIRLAGELREFQAPPPLFSARERTEWSAGLYSREHESMQSRPDFSKVIGKTQSSPADLTEARALLVPFLRDILVGLNYAYYEPPGAQMLHNNPLFVRSHDFAPDTTTPTAEIDVWRTPRMLGRGWTASGGVHLVGSLADIPYVLSQVEQDFIVPENTQSLIWADLVPDMLTSAILPRWWRVTPVELHAVALYQQVGEQLLNAASKDAALRQREMDVLTDYLLPKRQYLLTKALEGNRVEDALSLLMPSEVFFLTARLAQQQPQDLSAAGAAGSELQQLMREHFEETSPERVSADFGVPHPVLANSYARELLPLKPFPTFLGYSSRLLAESWESNNLYWARLADEKGLQPAVLHNLVPTLTRRMVEKIFASNLEDWPAVLRALRETGDEFRHGKIPVLARSQPPQEPISERPGAPEPR